MASSATTNNDKNNKNSNKSSVKESCKVEMSKSTTITTITRTKVNSIATTTMATTQSSAANATAIFAMPALPTAITTNGNNNNNNTIVTIKNECDDAAAATATTSSTSSSSSTAVINTNSVTIKVEDAPNTCSSNKQRHQQQQQQQQQHQHQQLLDEDNNDDANSSDNLILAKPRPICLSAVNSHIVCNLCFGYLIDATTIVECLHSFCHSCLIKHLRTQQYCPRCEMMINTAKPNIKPDTTLQAIVYKLVPGLYERELMRKRAFYKNRPEEAALATPEQRGEDTEHLIFSPTEDMSLSLEFADLDTLATNSDYAELLKPRYLQCPAKFTVSHLKKFVYKKYNIDCNIFNIDIMYKVKTIVLLDHYTLMDVAYIYTWKRDAHMRFYFRVKPRPIRRIVAPKRAPQVKQEVTPMTARTLPNASQCENDVTASNRLLTDAMTIVHVNAANNNNSEIKKSPNTATSHIVPDPLTEIKLEKSEAESIVTATVSSQLSSPTTINTNTSAGTTVAAAPKQTSLRKCFEIVPQVALKSTLTAAKASNSACSSATNKHLRDEDKRTEHFKITLVNKNAKDKTQQAIAAVTATATATMSAATTPKTSTNNKTVSSKDKHKEKKEEKEKKEAAPKDERKVENIKLKIDLSKQNSVTIINMSDPERKEIVKSVRPEKEWKVMKQNKSKDKDRERERHKDKDKSSNSSAERKSKTSPTSTQTVPPLTIKAGSISPRAQTKKSQANATSSTSSTTTNNSNLPTTTSSLNSSPTAAANEEEEKSTFLKLVNLTPIKSLQQAVNVSPEKTNKCPVNVSSSLKFNSPPKSPKKPANSNASTMLLSKSTPAAVGKKQAVMSPTATKPQFLTPNANTVPSIKRKCKESVSATAAKEQYFLPPSAIVPTSKRKSKEPIKTIIKKPKLSDAKPDFKIKPLPTTNNNNNNNDRSKTSNSSKNDNEKHEKLLMPPPAPLVGGGMKAPTFLPPKKPAAKTHMAHKNSFVATAGSMTSHHPAHGIPITPPGNRTPIAKRFQPILPKANPFANIPSDVNKLLRDVGTEIKSIPNESKTNSNSGNSSKVYGPKSAIEKSTNSAGVMLPPPTPPPQRYNSSSNMAPKSIAQKSNNSNNFLNLALFNASKTKGNEVPPGCRTPMYSPNSPIYSPNSPQYMPNYNIPTVPTHKYTKPANAQNNSSNNSSSSSSASSYLQSMLSAANSHLADLFPSPPVKREQNNSIHVISSSSSSTSQTNSNNAIQSTAKMDTNANKRPYVVRSFPKSPNLPEDPPEKQLKVQSLLNSCNINIPSSLSITIRQEDSDSQCSNSSYPKHNSPVNNYIEILKLPDQSLEQNTATNSGSEAQKRQSPPVRKPTPPAVPLPSTAKAKEDNSKNAPFMRHTQKPSPNGTCNNKSSKPAENKTQKPTSNNMSIFIDLSGLNHSNNSSASTANCKPKTPPATVTNVVSTNASNTNGNAKSNSVQLDKLDKKTPSPDKRSANVSPGSQKSQKSPTTANGNDGQQASKKFRPILPRQNPQNLNEVIPAKSNNSNASIIGNYTAPNAAATKTHGNKKEQTSNNNNNKKLSPTQQQQKQQQQQQQQASAKLPNHSPTLAKSTSQQQQQQQQQSLNLSKTSNTSAQSSSSTGNNKQNASKPNSNANKKVNNNSPNSAAQQLNNKIATPTAAAPHAAMLSSLSHTLMAGLPNYAQYGLASASSPSNVGTNNMAASTQKDLSNLFKENLLRVQVAAAAANPNNMFFNYANVAAQMPLINYQQAYIMDQLSRMHQAGAADPISDYLQKLKNAVAANTQQKDSNNTLTSTPKTSPCMPPASSPNAHTLTKSANVGTTATTANSKAK